MDTATDHTRRTPENRLRAAITEQFGRYCVFCGNGERYLKMDRLSRRRPESITNCVLICEECAEHHNPELFAPRERFAGRRDRWSRR
ncbi:hypothetical protein [Mycobacterium colombiense]|uniref:hypothetical protein n=1 Tax=Mycobacterium colombiense TaxID=339268 RepID=UPI0011E4D2F3|nr:hypothetical protein [Mycobacterium colombiense]